MQRRTFLAVTAIFSSCSKAPAPASSALPETLPGGWSKASAGPARDIPPAAAQLGVEDSASATYSGAAGTVELSAFRLRTETNAFDLMQRWRQSDGPAIYKGAYFFVARADKPEAAMKLLQALQTAQ